MYTTTKSCSNRKYPEHSNGGGTSVLFVAEQSKELIPFMNDLAKKTVVLIAC